jgi:hypothetical protein
VSRETDDPRFWLCERADTRACRALTVEHVPADSAILYTDAWPSYHGSHTAHATVCRSPRERARDDDGDGVRAVHCHTGEGAGAALHTYWRALPGVHQQDLTLYVATDDALLKATRVRPDLIRRMGVGVPSSHTDYT